MNKFAKKMIFTTKWTLKDLLRSPEKEFQTIGLTIMREVKAFEVLRKSLMSSRPRPAFLEALQRAERIARLIHRLEA